MTTAATHTPPTVEAFKTWAKDCAPAARAVLMARVFSEMERERVDAYVRPIFESYQFKSSAKWGGNLAGKPITDPKDLYLVDDSANDGAEMRAFYTECDHAHRAHGFKGPNGHCPALTAENLVRVTEIALIGLAVDLFGIESDNLYGDNREKYLELLIGACVKASKGTLR